MTTRSLNIVVALAVLPLLSLAGCASNPPLPSETFDAELRASVSAQKEPLVFTVAVATPIVIGPAAPSGTAAAGAQVSGATMTALAATPAPHGREKFVGPRAIDRGKLQTRLVDDVRALHLFRRVDPVPPCEVTPDPAAQRKLLAAAAREVHADLVLVPRLKVHEVAYVGATGWYVPSILLCATLWFPTFFFPDETWSARATLEVELLSARTGKVIWGPSEFPARREEDMDDFDRGWDLCGPWGIPLFTGSETLGVQESNCRTVAARLLPATLADSERGMLKALLAYLRRVPVKLEATEPQTIALVIGADHYADPAAPALECAESDALTFAAFLRTPAGGGIGDRNLHLLLGKDATRAQILDVLNVELTKTAPADKVLIYYAGYGAAVRDGGAAPGQVATWRPYLVPVDADSKRIAETGIALDDLTQAIDKAAAEKVVVILDTSFGGEGTGRTLPTARPEGSDVVDRRPLDHLVQRPGRFALLSTDLGGIAQEYTPERHGIFTMLLDQGLREIDAEKAGARVSLAELVDYLKERLPPSSSLVGERQEVTLFGDRDAARAVIVVDRSRSLVTATPERKSP